LIWRGQDDIPETFNERPGIARMAGAEKMRENKARRMEVENIIAHQWVKRS